MVQKYLFFGFDECNFASERKRMIDYLDSLGGGVNVQCLKEFPPCVLDKDYGIKVVGREIVFSSKDFLVGHNLFFGEDYVKINKRFRDSPFISDNCKQCEHFKSFHCRGLFNKKFLDAKEEIVQRRGEEQYGPLMLDYSNGHIVFTSRYNPDCCFLGEGIEPPDFLTFVNPDLSVSEILHFMHYLPQEVYANSFFARCFCGEPLLHKDIKRILKIVKNFVGCYHVATDGRFLNAELLDLINSLNFRIDLPLYSVNNDLRKKCSWYKEDVDVKAIIDKILEKNAKMQPIVWVLNENIANGDLKESLLYLLKKGLYPKIPLNICSLHGAINEVKNMNYDEEFLIDYLKKCNLAGSILLQPALTKENLSEFAESFRMYIQQLTKNNKTLILSPKYSYTILKKALSGLNNINIEGLTNNLGINKTLSCSLTVDVFLEALSRIDYDLLVIPRQSFDFLMKDVRGGSINALVSKIDKKVILSG